MTPVPVQPSAPDPLQIANAIRENSQKDRDFFDRLFTKTIWALGIVGGALTLLAGAALCFIYIFLGRTREDAAATAKAEVQRLYQTEAKKQVEEALRALKVDALIQQVVAEKAMPEITNTISRELTKPEFQNTLHQTTNKLIAERLAPRHLSDLQKGIILKVLQNQPPHTVYLFAGMDGESLTFAGEFFVLLQNAKWKPITVPFMGGTDPGFAIFVRDNQNPPPGTQVLADALRQARINAPIKSPIPNVSLPMPETADLCLMVGSRF